MGKFIQEKIGIIGAGNLGTSLGLSLKEKGVSVVFNSSFYNNEIDGVKNEKNINKFLSETDLIFIVVKDRDIKKKVNILKKHNIKGKTIIHCSGFYSSDILSGLKEKGAIIGSFHPIISIPEKYMNINNIKRKIFASYEGDKEGKKIVLRVFKNFNFTIFDISSKDKIPFHLSLTIFSNYPFYIIELGKLLFDRINFKYDKKGFLDDFIEISVKNYLKTGKISGPLSRGDYSLIEEELKNVDNKKIQGLIKKIIKLSEEIRGEVVNEES